MRTFVVTLAFLLSATVSSAASAADTYVIPVAGHVSGANGETWMTDVTLHNVSASTLVVDFAGIGSDGNVVDLDTETVTVGAHGTLTLRDLVRPTAVGAVVVAGSGPFTITSRVYSEGPHGSVGTDVATVNEFLDAAGGDAFLPGLIANSRYRTNIGFFAIANATALQFEITLLDADGTPLGTKALEVPAGRLSHLQINSREIAPMTFDVATARLRVTGGDGVLTAYASVVDNISGDASFVAAALLQQSPETVLRSRVLLQRLIPAVHSQKGDTLSPRAVVWAASRTDFQ